MADNTKQQTGAKNSTIVDTTAATNAAKSQPAPKREAFPGASLVAFAPGIICSAPKGTQGKVFQDEKTQQCSRKVVMMHIPTFGPDGKPSKLYARAAVSIRWNPGSEDVEPYLSTPSFGGRGAGNSAFETDDDQTADAYNNWKDYALQFGLDWLEEQAKNGARQTAAPSLAKRTIKASGLGITLAIPQPRKKNDTDTAAAE